MFNSKSTREVCTDLVILIATKDRPRQIMNLLKSLEISTMLPVEIIIVVNGEDINPQVEKFKNTLNIKIIKSDIGSQVFQKKLGLDHLPSTCKWVLFLDDDVLVNTDSIKLLINNYVLNNSYRQYAGFGMAIRNRRLRDVNHIIRYLLFVIKLFSFKPGSVTQGGHPQSYLNEIKSCEVEWLNGISLWKKEVLHLYRNIPSTAGYSAYEDVSFSYQVSRIHKLIFAADCFVSDQICQNNKPLTTNEFVLGCYARFVFVKSHSNMSCFWFAIGQVIRSVDFVIKSKVEGCLISRTMVSVRSLFEIQRSIIKRDYPSKLLLRSY